MRTKRFIVKGDVSLKRLKSKQTRNYFRQSTKIRSIEGVDCIHLCGRDTKWGKDHAQESVIEEPALNLA